MLTLVSSWPEYLARVMWSECEMNTSHFNDSHAWLEERQDRHLGGSSNEYKVLFCLLVIEYIIWMLCQERNPGRYHVLCWLWKIKHVRPCADDLSYPPPLCPGRYVAQRWLRSSVYLYVSFSLICGNLQLSVGRCRPGFLCSCLPLIDALCKCL